MEKMYGELMSVLLQNRLRHGNESGFRAYVVESVRTLASDLREFGLELSVRQASPAPVSPQRDNFTLKVGCE
jgi:hypothetical protein